jgi:hypothetical protein
MPPYDPDRMIKFAVLVDEDKYNNIKDKMHFGQATEFFREMIYALSDIVDTHGTTPLMEWLYLEKDLILKAPPKKEKS